MPLLKALLPTRLLDFTLSPEDAITLWKIMPWKSTDNPVSALCEISHCLNMLL
jgi:hypothetical protein